MAYDFSKLKNNLKETEEWLARELSGVRTGRATPSAPLAGLDLRWVAVDADGRRSTVTPRLEVTNPRKDLLVVPLDVAPLDLAPLLADAAHMASDVVGLVVALVAQEIGRAHV